MTAEFCLPTNLTNCCSWNTVGNQSPAAVRRMLLDLSPNIWPSASQYLIDSSIRNPDLRCRRRHCRRRRRSVKPPVLLDEPIDRMNEASGRIQLADRFNAECACMATLTTANSIYFLSTVGYHLSDSDGLLSNFLADTRRSLARLERDTHTRTTTTTTTTTTKNRTDTDS
jgi:hypothetical protein